MNVATIGRSGSVAIAIMASAVNLSAVMPAVADVNVGALACQALSNRADSGLVWNQHTLINPPNSGVTRWVVCDIPFESVTMPAQFYIGAFGLNDENHTGSTSLCYANVVDLRNQNVQAPFGVGGDPFLDNAGQQLTFTKKMETKTKVDYLWSSWVKVSQDQIIGSMDEPPVTPISRTALVGPNYWTITINCQLKPGQALNMVSLFWD